MQAFVGWPRIRESNMAFQKSRTTGAYCTANRSLLARTTTAFNKANLKKRVESWQRAILGVWLQAIRQSCKSGLFLAGELEAALTIGI